MRTPPPTGGAIPTNMFVRVYPSFTKPFAMKSPNRCWAGTVGKLWQCSEIDRLRQSAPDRAQSAGPSFQSARTEREWPRAKSVLPGIPTQGLDGNG